MAFELEETNRQHKTQVYVKQKGHERMQMVVEGHKKQLEE